MSVVGLGTRMFLGVFSICALMASSWSAAQASGGYFDLLATKGATIPTFGDNITEWIRLLSDGPISGRLNESEYGVSIGEWQKRSVGGVYDTIMRIDIPAPSGQIYRAQLVSEKDAFFVGPESRIHCVASAATQSCNITLELQATGEHRSQFARAILLLDPLSGPATTTPFLALSLPLPSDPCLLHTASMEALLAATSSDNPNPFRFNVTTAVPTTSIEAWMSNSGNVAGKFSAFLECNHASPLRFVVHPAVALQCTLPSGQGCPVTWRIFFLEPVRNEPTLVCHVRFAIARLPCWSQEGKYRDQVITLVLPQSPTEAIPQDIAVAMGVIVALVGTALLAFVVAWFISERFKHRQHKTEKQAKEQRKTLLQQNMHRQEERSPFLISREEEGVDDL